MLKIETKWCGCFRTKFLEAVESYGFSASCQWNHIHGNLVTSRTARWRHVCVQVVGSGANRRTPQSELGNCVLERVRIKSKSDVIYDQNPFGGMITNK